jgi:glycosyltransferase involved in cell wall biosynthesis
MHIDVLDLHHLANRVRSPADRLRIVQFARGLYLGGTEIQFVELLRGLAPSHDLWVGVMEAKGPHLARVRELGFEPREFPIRGGVLRPNTAMQIGALARWLAETGADVVHVHAFAPTLLAVPAAKLAGCRVVVSRLDLAHYHSAVQRRVLAQLTRLADRVVVNAEAIRRMLIREEHVAPERIAVIHNGIDLRRFDACRALPLEAPLPDTGGRPVILHVANMSHPVKRQEDLLAALVELRAHGVDAHAFLVGDGPRRPELEQRARELGLEDRAHFLGYRQDVPALCGHAAVGVLCSAAEGLSNAIMEGMAASLPMVVTDVGGNTDLVEHRARGLVIPPRDPRALASAITWVLEHPEAAARMGEAARAYVERELTVAAMVAAHEAVYLDAVRPSRREDGSAPTPRGRASAAP